MRHRTWFIVFVLGTVAIMALSLVAPFTHSETHMGGTDMRYTTSEPSGFAEPFMTLFSIFLVGMITLFICMEGENYLKKR